MQFLRQKNFKRLVGFHRILHDFYLKTSRSFLFNFPHPPLFVFLSLSLIFFFLKSYLFHRTFIYTKEKKRVEGMGGGGNLILRSIESSLILFKSLFSPRLFFFSRSLPRLFNHFKIFRNLKTRSY